MSVDPPTPPTSLSPKIVNTLADADPEQLQEVARYAEELAEHREREARREEAEEEADRPDELPDNVPAKATITVKEINGNRYQYWQWRDGDTVKSKYKGPVNPDD